jgi:alpha-glucosidase
MEFSAYTPLFRNHAMNTSPAREPWAFGEPTLSAAREILNERYRLLPYLYTLVEQASRTGEPSLVPLFYYFPADPQTWTDDTSFMVGESMLVAPVVTEGATSRSVYLPGQGNWLDASTGASYAAGQSYTVSAPLGRIPVFVRAGAIIPKGPVVQHTGERPLTELHVHLYPGPESSFTLYEDDGTSFDYQSGAYARTRIARRDDGSTTTCVIERVAGTLAPPAGRAWYLEFRDVPAFAVPVANGQTLTFRTTEADLAAAQSGWTQAADGHVVVKVPDASAPMTVELTRVPLPS